MKKILLFMVVLLLVVCGAAYLGFSTHKSVNETPIKHTKKIEKQSKKTNSQKNKNKQEENQSSQTKQTDSNVVQSSKVNKSDQNENQSSQTKQTDNNANLSPTASQQLQPQQNQSDSSGEPIDGIDGNSDYGVYAALLRAKGQTPLTYAQFAKQNHFQMAPNSDPITGNIIKPSN